MCGEYNRREGQNREEEGERQKKYRGPPQPIRALNCASVCGVPRDARIHSFAIGGLDALDAMEPPRAMTEHVLADFTGAQDAEIVSQSYALNRASKSCSVFSSFSWRAAIVRSPRVRSKTPRTISVVRLKPPVSASGKSIVTRSE